MKLAQKVAIVTGAGRNIGEAVAHVFADEGARVAVVDMDEGRARTVADAINEEHRDAALPLVCDVSSGQQVEGMVRRVVETWGGVDILVNNVAISDHKPVMELEEAEWDAVMSVTLKSQFLCTKYAARQMVEKKRAGRIVNIASTSGHRGRADATAYSAAKAAILNFTRSVAIQLSPYGIRVNSITPNQIGSPVGLDYIPENRNPRNLVGRPGTPSDIAKAVLFLVSDEADFITAADLLVDGGSQSGSIPTVNTPRP